MQVETFGYLGSRAVRFWPVRYLKTRYRTYSVIDVVLKVLAIHPRRNHRPIKDRSAKISAAQLCPGAPVTPPPGWVPAPHIYSPFIGPRYAPFPRIGRAAHS